MATGSLSGILLAIDYTSPVDALVAVSAYAVPLMVFGIFLLFYQRNLPQEDLLRNIIVITGVLSLVGTALAILYAGFGSMWWGPEGLTFGSWGTFVAALRIGTEFIFGGIWLGVLYLIGVGFFMVILAYFVVSPVEPDVVAMRRTISEARAEADALRSQLQELEAENKRLNEFLVQREDRLAELEKELSGLRDELARLESEAPSEEKFRADIAERDERIRQLQAEVQQLRGELASRPAVVDDASLEKLRSQLAELQKDLEELRNRSETATQVAESVISDTDEVVRSIEESSLEPRVKETLVTIVRDLDDALKRVSGPPTDDRPRVEMIGAVMMLHEIVDSVKRLTRG